MKPKPALPESCSTMSRCAHVTAQAQGVAYGTGAKEQRLNGD